MLTDMTVQDAHAAGRKAAQTADSEHDYWWTAPQVELDTITTDDTLSLMFSVGFGGHDFPIRVEAVRVGHIGPGQTRSRNYRDDCWERGISVLHLAGDRDQSDGTYAMFNDGPRVQVRGYLSPWAGSDGEPLLIAAEETT